MKSIRETISLISFNKLLHPVVVMSLTLSFFLWLLIRLSLTYRTVIAVDVDYVGLPENVVWTVPPRSTLTVEVQADGWSLLRWKWLRNPKVEVEMYDQSRVTDYLVTQNFRNSIAAQMTSAQSLGGIFPDTLQLVSEPLDTIEVGTDFNGQIDYAEGYAPSSKPDFTPDRVQLIGPQSALAGMRVLTNTRVELRDVSQNLNQSLTWKLPALVSVLGDTLPRIEIQVDRTTEKLVEVPIQIVNGKKATVFPSSAQVLIAIPISRYERIGEWDFRIEAEIPDLENQPDYIKLNIVEKPWYVDIIELRPQRVEYLVSYD